MDESASLESKEKGVDAEVSRWMKEIELADKREKRWRKDAQEAIKIYRSEQFLGGDNEKRKETFNILWSNTETQRPALYNSTPRPDIRRRFHDKDVLGRYISELMERAASYTLDCEEFDDVMIAAVNDQLIPGRAVTRVRYVPTMSEEESDDDGNITKESEVEYEEIEYEQVQYDDFRHGPGKTWDEVPWEAFKHLLTKDQMEDKFPDFADKVTYDATFEEDSEKKTEDDSVFKRCLVWEIWDKDEREVLFLAPCYKDAFIGRKPDPLKLKEFFPNPRPLYAIESSTTLVPVTEYSMYETLARELEDVTNRMRKIVKALRVRGVYDSSISELSKLFDAADNDMIPATDIARLIEQGGIDKSIWMFPNETLAKTLVQLYQYREQIVGQIYEITGISDIIRGATDPNETLGAQEIKANFGSQRLQRKQREVQRYARDLIRLTVELIAENFAPQTLSLMTGLKFPTAEEKQLYQQQVMVAQQMQQQPPPQLVEMLQKPTWEEIQQILSNDVLREFRIDIETDSTIQADQQKDQQAIAMLVQSMGTYITGISGAVQSGVVTMEAAKKLMMSFIRRFRLGRDVEEAFDEQGQAGPTPEQQKMQAEQKAEEAKLQLEQQKMQMEGQKSQASMQSEQMKTQLDQQKAQLDAQLRKQQLEAEAQLKRYEIDVNANFRARELELEDRKMALEERKLEIEAYKAESDRKAKETQKPEFSLKGGRLSAA